MQQVHKHIVIVIQNNHWYKCLLVLLLQVETTENVSYVHCRYATYMFASLAPHVYNQLTFKTSYVPPI